jgi:hypothetical protein
MCYSSPRVITFYNCTVTLQILVDCSGNDNDEKNPETAFSNKRTALLKIIEESPVRKTIVFCNKVLVPLPCISVYHHSSIPNITSSKNKK